VIFSCCARQPGPTASGEVDGEQGGESGALAPSGGQAARLGKACCNDPAQRCRVPLLKRGFGCGLARWSNELLPSLPSQFDHYTVAFAAAAAVAATAAATAASCLCSVLLFAWHFPAQDCVSTQGWGLQELQATTASKPHAPLAVEACFHG